MCGECVVGRVCVCAGETAIEVDGMHPTRMYSCFTICFFNICVEVSRGYTDHYQGRDQAIRLTATLINIHEPLI